MAWFEHGTSRIYFEESGTGTPVLLLPGLTGSIDEFAPLRDVLVHAGYRVIAADLPGSGKSGPQPRSYTSDYYRQDARLFAAILEQLSAAPAHVIGFSDGGETALLMAIQTPSTVRSLFIWGAAGALSDPSGQLLESFANVIDNPIPPMIPFRDYLVSMYGLDNARAMTTSAANALGEIVANGGDISQSRANEITCPTRVIAGEDDPFATRELVSGLQAQIPASQVDYLQGVGHNVYGERTEWLTQQILAWLREH